MPAPATCVVSGTIFNSAGAPAANSSLFLKRVLKNGVLFATGPTISANVPQLNGGNSTVQYIQEIKSDASGGVAFTVPRASTATFEGNASGFNNGELALSIPDTPTSTLEALVPATFPISTTNFNFLALLDTPDDYTGHALESVRVNTLGTGLEFAPAGSGYSDAQADARIALARGVTVQAWDADLDFVAANLTAFGRTLIDDANAAAGLATLGLAATLNFFGLAGPSALRTYTFPDANATIARTDAGQTFTGNQVVNGNITFTDNTYDIGASGATRPKNVYVAGQVTAGSSINVGLDLNMPSANSITWAGRSKIFSDSNGALRIGSNASTGFSSLVMGATAPATIGALPANGQTFTALQASELLTIAASPTTTTTMQIPANAVVLGVSVRVTTVIPTAATFTVKVGAQVFSTAAVNVAANSTDPGTAAGAWFNATAQGVIITPNLTPGAATGVVRVTVMYYLVTPPTS